MVPRPRPASALRGSRGAGGWGLLVVGAALLALPLPSSEASEEGFVAAKMQRWLQVTGMAPIPDPTTPYAFVAEAWMPSGGLLAAARLAGPGGSETALPTRGAEAAFSAGSPDPASLDGAWPDGSYRLSLQPASGPERAGTVVLGPGSFPPAPEFLDPAALVSLSARLPHLIQWRPLSGGTLVDRVELRIEDIFGEVVFRSPRPGDPGALNGTHTAFQLPARTLTNGFIGVLRITFLSTTSVSGAAELPGSGARGASTALYFFATDDLPSADLVGWSQLRGRGFTQGSEVAAQPVALPEGGWSFEGVAQAADMGLVRHATLEPPGSLALALAAVGAADPDAYRVVRVYDSESALGASFPLGAYAWSMATEFDGQHAIDLLQARAAVPAPPRVLEASALLEVSPDAPGAIRWIAPPNPGPHDRHQLLIESPQGGLIYRTPHPFAPEALGGAAAEAPLPRLPRGRSFVGRLRFIAVETLDETSYVGAVGLAGTFAETRFEIRTTLGNLSPQAAISSTALPDGRVGEEYSGVIECSDSIPPRTWALVSGTLPPGLELDPDAGEVWGTPAAAGEYRFAVRVTDRLKRTAEASLTLSVSGVPAPLSVTSTNLPAGETGRLYVTRLLADGGVFPYTWSLSSATPLPAGLALDPAFGLVSGDPTTVGTNELECVVEDALGQTASRRLTLAIAAGEADLPLAFGPCRRVADSIELVLTGEPDLGFTLESSVDLATWTPVLVTNLPAAGPVTLVLPGLTGHAFFRAREGAETAAPSPWQVRPRLDLARSATLYLPTRGGTLVLTNAAGTVFELVLPANAMPDDTPVTMTVVEAVDGLPPGFQFVGGVELEPDGARLEVPAQLTQRLAGGLPDDLVGLAWVGDGEDFHLRDVIPDGNTLRFDLLHFSGASAGTAPKDATRAAAQSNVPCALEARLHQEMGALHAAWYPAMPPADEIWRVLTHFHAFALLPKVRAAMADENQLEEAWRLWLTWDRYVALLQGVPDPHGSFPALEALSAKTGAKVQRASQEAIKRLHKRGVSENRPELIMRMIKISRDLTLFFADPNQGGLAEILKHEASSLVRFELEFESRVEINSSQGTSIAHVRSKRAKLRGEGDVWLRRGFLETAEARLEKVQFVPFPPRDGSEFYGTFIPGNSDVTLFRIRWTAKEEDQGANRCPKPPEYEPEMSCILSFLDPIRVWGRGHGVEALLGNGWLPSFKALERERALSPADLALGGDLVATTSDAFRFPKEDWSIPGRRLYGFLNFENSHSDADGTLHHVSSIQVYHTPWKTPAAWRPGR